MKMSQKKVSNPVLIRIVRPEKTYYVSPYDISVASKERMRPDARLGESEGRFWYEVHMKTGQVIGFNDNVSFDRIMDAIKEI